MSAGDEWANDAPPRRGCPLLPSAALLVLALAAVLALTLTGCRDTEPTPVSPAPPVTGVQPQPPVTAVAPSAVQVKP